MSSSRSDRAAPIVYLIFFFAAALAIYCNYVFLYHVNDLTGVAFAASSRAAHEGTLAGTRTFPYQWRVLGSYLVRWGTLITGSDVHSVDVALKILFLFLSTIPLFKYSRDLVDPFAAMAVVFLYLLLVVVGLSEEYSIYNTNDIILYAGWHLCVYAAFHKRFYLVAASIFLTTFAREVTVLACVLIGLGFLRRRVGFVPTVVVGLAFIVPWGLLRWIYPAPLSEMAWWHNFYGNIPIFNLSGPTIITALRRSAKVFFFFNVFWILGIIHLLRSRNKFMMDLFLVMCFYVTVLYITVNVRELRQFVPLAIVLLPAGIKELQTRFGLGARDDEVMESRHA